MRELMHGYTVHDIHAHARRSAANNHFLAHDHIDLVHAAWDAIIDGILEAEQRPTAHDLNIWGRKGIWDLVNGHRTMYGYRNKDGFAGMASAPRFVTYWTNVEKEPPTERLLDLMALDQVWQQLSDQDRALIGAMAACGTPASAADALQLKHTTFNTYLRRAVVKAQTLWHDGETPHRVGHYSRRRHHNVDRQPCGTHAAYRRHKKYGEPVDPACAEANRTYERENFARRRARERAA